MNNKYLEIFFNTKVVGEAWYASAFYRYTTIGIRRFAFYIPRSRLKFHPIYIGVFLLFVLLFPSSLWDNFYMVPAFMLVSLIYISHNSTQRTGVIFILINIIIFMFIAMMSMSIPIAACKSLSYFLLAVDLFFLISFTVRTQDDSRIKFNVSFPGNGRFVYNRDSSGLSCRQSEHSYTRRLRGFDNFCRNIGAAFSFRICLSHNFRI